MNNFFEMAINKIAVFCEENKIPYIKRGIYEGFQLRFPWCDGDIACHAGTYGSNEGYVESYQFPWDNGDVTMLTPKECCEKLLEYYNHK